MFILTCFLTDPGTLLNTHRITNCNHYLCLRYLCDVYGLLLSDLQCCQVSAQNLELLNDDGHFFVFFLPLLQSLS